MWQKGIYGKGESAKLLQIVWYYLMKCLGFRGFQEASQLMVGDLEIKTDSTGVEYIERNERLTKNRNRNTNHISVFPPNIFANVDQPEQCIVSMLKVFK